MKRWMFVVFAAGCAKAPTVDTDDLLPSYLAADLGTGVVEIDAQLMMTDSGFYQLGDGERLVAKLGDQMQTLTLDGNRYKAMFTAEPEAETRFAIELYRSDEMITSTMGFPGPFDVSPVAASIPAGQTIQMTWSPPDSGGDHTSVVIDARPCTPSFVGDSDPSSVTFSMHGPAGVTCQATVGFYRDRVTDANPAFDEAGVLEAVQTRFVSFVSTP